MIGLEAAKAARTPAPAPGPALVVGPGGIGQGAGSSVAANNQFPWLFYLTPGIFNSDECSPASFLFPDGRAGGKVFPQ